jgi:hypothetical protein
MKDKIRVYMKSGNYIDIKCKNATFDWDNIKKRYTGYHIVGANKNFGIDPEQIEAWKSL